MMIPHNSKGFTIMEVMIAMVIFAIGILGMVKLQVAATLGNTTSRTMSEATAAAVDNIEKLLNDSYDDTADIPAGTPVVLVSESGVPYNISRTVKEIQLNPSSNTYNVKQIETVVQWNDRGQSKTFSVSTYKSLTSDKGKSE